MKSEKLIIQFTKFVIVGILNTSIDFLVLNIIMWLTGISSGVYMILFNSVSFFIASVNSYLLNKYWTFIDPDKDKFKKIFQFYSVTLISVLLNNLIVFSVTTYIPPIITDNPKIWANIAKIMATGVSFLWNFIGYRYLVFKKKEISNE